MKRFSTLLTVLMLVASGTATWAQSLSVGGVKVNLDATSTQTITGSKIEGKVTYSPSSRTLYLDNATINGDISGIGLGSSASTRYFIHLTGSNSLITSNRGIRFDDSYVVLYGAAGASLFINSLNSSSGYSCISTEGGHFEVWSVKLDMLGASKGFYGTPSSATLNFVNSIVHVNCDAGAVYGYKSVSYDDCLCTDEGSKFQSGKGYVDASGDLVNEFYVWPILSVGDEPVRTASSIRTGTRYPWKWTKETKTLELTGSIDAKAYSGIANRGIEGLTIKVEDYSLVQSSNIGVGVDATTNFAGGGTLNVVSTTGNAIVACADVDICMKAFSAAGRRYGFTDSQSGHKLSLHEYNTSSTYTFAGETMGDIYSSSLLMPYMDIANDNTYWNPTDGHVYEKNTIKKAKTTDASSYTVFKSETQLEYTGISVGELRIRKNFMDYIMPPGLTNGTVKYNASTKTLTLTDVTLLYPNGILGNGIYNSGIEGLTVKLVGNNTITTRSSAVYSAKTFTITGNGSLVGTAANGHGLYLNGTNMVCTIVGPQLEFTGNYALCDITGMATLALEGSSTRLTLQPENDCEAVYNLGALSIGDGLSILEPSDGVFNSGMKSITTGGDASAYKGRVVIGHPTDYGMFIAETRVNSANAADILGDGQFSYDASTKTLTVTNANLTNIDGSLGGGISNREVEGLTVKLIGNSTITTRNDPVYSEKSFTIAGDGSLVGTGTSGWGLFLAGDHITCTIDGPRLEFAGFYGLYDYTGTATVYVEGSTTRLTLKPKANYEAVYNLGDLYIGSGLGILEPSGGFFDASLKSITTDGTSAYMGEVVIGKQSFGDLNGDGSISIADAVCVLEAMAADSKDPRFDLNGDGTVSIADFVAVLEIMAAQ